MTVMPEYRTINSLVCDGSALFSTTIVSKGISAGAWRASERRHAARNLLPAAAVMITDTRGVGDDGTSIRSSVVSGVSASDPNVISITVSDRHSCDATSRAQAAFYPTLKVDDQ